MIGSTSGSHSDRLSVSRQNPAGLFPVNGHGNQLDKAAAAVLERSGGRSLDTGLDPAQARLAYKKGRLPLIGTLEDVARIERHHPRNRNEPSLTIFYPESESPAPLPAIVFLHGGGWVLGDLEVYEPLCRSLANATGAALIWVEYRLSPEAPFPTPLHDTWIAVEWIQANAAQLGIDPTRIGIGGDSAGGNLAAATAIAARNGHIRFKPAFQLLLYPCLDMTVSQPSHRLFAEGYGLTASLYEWYRTRYLGHYPALLDWRVSPVMTPVLSDLAPTILLYAGHDILRDEAALYASRLESAGVTVERLYFPGMIHGFLTMAGAIPCAHAAIERIGSTVKKFTGEKGVERVKGIEPSS